MSWLYQVESLIGHVCGSFFCYKLESFLKSKGFYKRTENNYVQNERVEAQIL